MMQTFDEKLFSEKKTPQIYNNSKFTIENLITNLVFQRKSIVFVVGVILFLGFPQNIINFKK